LEHYIRRGSWPMRAGLSPCSPRGGEHDLGMTKIPT
jgi:hypothetical protein